MIFLLLNIRGFLNGLGFDVLWISLLFNGLIFVALEYRRMSVLSAFSVFYLFAALSNFSAIAVFDILIISNLIKKFSIHKLALINVVMIVIFLLCLYVLSSYGFLISNEWVSPKGIATSLGLNNPNALGMWFFYLIINMRLSLHERPSTLFYIISILLAFSSFNLCYSRTALVATILFLLMVILYDRFRFGFRGNVIACLPITVFITILLITFFIAKSFPEVDILFSFRFSIYLRLLSELSLWRLITGFQVPEGQAMDNAFLMLLFEGGIMIVMILMYNFYKTVKNSRHIYIPFIISMLLAGITENTFSAPSTTSMLFWSMILCKRNEIFAV